MIGYGRRLVISGDLVQVYVSILRGKISHSVRDFPDEYRRPVKLAFLCVVDRERGWVNRRRD